MTHLIDAARVIDLGAVRAAAMWDLTPHVFALRASRALDAIDRPMLVVQTPGV